MTEWHAVSSQQAMKILNSPAGGLSESEAAERLERDGRNSIAMKKKISPLSIFINQFKNTLVILLVAAAAVSLAVSYMNPEKAEYLDAVLIFVILIANAAFGFMQEYKAEKSIEALTKMAAPYATVMRSGKEVKINSEEVVAGDILVLREGDRVAADARVIESFSIHADESSLTGESVPVQKSGSETGEKTPLAERTCMLYMSTVITRGRGTAVVVETGARTEVGKIAKEISDAPEKITRFKLEIEDIGKKISRIVGLMLIVIIASEFLLNGGELLLIFMTAIALGVAAIPEGLPAVVTLALSIATNRMLKQKALLRRLSTIQDLGSVDIICTDKTGTLTENSMTVVEAWVPGIGYKIEGSGLSKQGKIISGTGRIDELELMLHTAALCNDAAETEEGFSGDPTEIAVMLPAYKAGVDVELLRRMHKRLDEIPFSSERKLMATVNNYDNRKCAFVKGAPEMLVSKCTHISQAGKIRRMTKGDIERIAEQNKKMGLEALRVLAFGYKENPKSSDEKDVESELVFLGLMGMMDPPRKGVKEALDDSRKAGIRVVMLTGDNRYTAEAIGKELGFRNGSLTGEELDEMGDKELKSAVERIDVYARTSPTHKVAIARALKANGHIICMTGDGVNDAAAIKNTDVGIAMGIRGTEVTKQASDMIILDDNFITIKNAIAEGRGTFDNIRKFVILLLGANTAEVLSIFIASILSLGMSPRIAVQLLWINLLTDGLPALALGADPPAKDIMNRKPRPANEKIIDKHAMYFIGINGLGKTIAVIALLAYYLAYVSEAKAYSIFFTSFVIFDAIGVYIVRWKYGTRLSTNKWLHAAVALSVLLQLGVLYTGAASWFGVVPLGIDDWAAIALAELCLVAFMLIGIRIEHYFIKPK